MTQVTKIYCLSTDDIDTYHGDLTDEQFISEATRHGDTYSLEDFAKAFNDGDVNTNTDAIRIITTEIQNHRDQRIIVDIEWSIEKVNEQIQEGKEKSFTIGWMISSLNNIKTILSTK